MTPPPVKAPPPVKERGKPIRPPRALRLSSRSNYQAFHSPLAETRALIRELNKHLKTEPSYVPYGSITKEKWSEWTSQTEEIEEQLLQRQITPNTALPRLKEIATNAKYEGGHAKKKGHNWIYNQAAHKEDEQQQIPETPEFVQHPGPMGLSPNLLETDDDETALEKSTRAKQQCSDDLDDIFKEHQDSEKTEEWTTPGTEKTTPKTEQEKEKTEKQQYYDLLSTPDSSSESSSSRSSEAPRPIPPQESLSPQSSSSKEYTQRTVQNYQKQKLDQNQQLEEMINDQIKEAQENLKKHTETQHETYVAKSREHAETQHETFVTMSRNNMTQYTDKVTATMKEMNQELQTSIKSMYKSAKTSFATLHKEHEKSLTKTCRTVSEKHEAEVRESTKRLKEKLQAEAESTERHLNQHGDELVEEAQSILNQMPMDMGTIKEELEEELRNYGERVRQGLQEEQDENQVRTLGRSLMAEMRNQANEYKAEINSFIGPSLQDKIQPALETMKKEITETKKEQANLEAKWRKLNQEMDGKWLSFKDEATRQRTELDEMGMRLALSEVENAKLKERTEVLENMAKQHAARKIDERLDNLEIECQGQFQGQDNLDTNESLKRRLTKMDARARAQETTTEQLAARGDARLRAHATEMTTLETQRTQAKIEADVRAIDNAEVIRKMHEEETSSKQRITALEERVSAQDKEIRELTKSTEDSAQDPRLATPDNEEDRKRAARSSSRNNDRSSREQESRGHSSQRYPDSDEDEDEDEAPSNRWGVDPSTITWKNEDRQRDRKSNQRDRKSSTSNRDRYEHDSRDRSEDGYGRDERRDRRRDGRETEMSDDERRQTETAVRSFERKSLSELPNDKPTGTQIESLYRAIAHAADSSGVPMRSLPDVIKGEPIYPANTTRRYHPHSMACFSRAIYHLLEKLIPESVEIYRDILAQHTRTEDGYTALYQILSIVSAVLQDFRPPWGPTLTKDINMYRFVNQMQKHIDQEATFNRPYTELEVVTNIIQHALKDDRYEMAARTAKATIENNVEATTVPPGLTMKKIAHTLEPSNQRVLTREFAGDDTPTLHKFETKRALDPKKQVQCRSCQAWGHDGLCYMMCKMVHIQQWIADNPEEAKKQSESFRTSNSKHMIKLMEVTDEEALYQGIENMWIALDEKDNSDEPNVQLRKMQAPQAWDEYPPATTGPMHPFSMATEYIDSRIIPPTNSPSKPQKTDGIVVTKMTVNMETDVRHLRFTHQADGGANFAATDRIDLLHNYRTFTKPIAIVAFFPQEGEGEKPQEQAHTAIGEGILKLIGDHGEIIPMRMLYTPKSTGTVISPERTMKDIQRNNPKGNRIVNWSQNGGQQPSLQWKDKEERVLSSLAMEERNGLYYIKNATLLPPPKPTVKAMQGIETIEEVAEERPTAAKAPVTPIQVETVTEDDEEDDTAAPTQHRTTPVLTAEPDGASFMEPIDPVQLKSTPIRQRPTDKEKKREPIQVETVTEEDDDEAASTAPPMEPGGAYFMEPIDFTAEPGGAYYPEPPDHASSTPTPTLDSASSKPTPTLRPVQIDDNDIPPKPPATPAPPAEPGEERRWTNPQTTASAASGTTKEPKPSTPAPSNLRTTSWTSGLTKGIRQLEIWHQRMGHPSPTVLQRTQRSVEGIPKLPNAAPIFHCRYCDKAKQHKSARGKPEQNNAYLPGTMFHMDLGFFRGPSNLPSVVNDGAQPSKETVIKSIEGYVTYLSIVDAATRYLWVFPLKSKNPPTEVIESFLRRYGSKHPNRTISTDPEGQLAQSQMFKHMCERNGFDLQAHDDEEYQKSTMDDLLTSILEQPRVIRTDGGKEFAGSEEFRATCNKHNYDVQVTGPDTSSQNGKGERPHRTLAEKTKCLLYTATLGVEFWCSAIVYACYLYNRTHHSAIDQTPYEAFTGFKPNCSHILTYGCTVTAKKPSGRTTKADPNTYEGIFLGFGATSQNLKYHDIHTQRRKWAHHCTMDEFQYGDDPKDRSTASKHILESFTQLPHDKIGGKKLHQATKPIMIDPIPRAQYPNPISLQLDPLPYTAAAAKFERPQEQDLNKALEQFNISLDDNGPVISEKVLLRGTHPLLGMGITVDKDNPNRLYLQNCTPSTPMAVIPRWRSRLRGAHIRSINDIPVHSIADIRSIVQDQRQKRQPSITIQMAKPLVPAMTDHGVPQLHLDQLNVVAHHLDAIKQNRTESWKGSPTDMPPLDEDDIAAAISKGLAIPRLTRRTVLNSPQAAKWKKSEWTQLSKYQNQGMFGDPCARPHDPNAVILPFVWTYVHKMAHMGDEIVEKARATCNGGKRHGKAVTIAETYAACVEQPAQRLYWALVASLNLTAIGCDVGNAFAEAPPPSQPFYMYIDDQFRDWWENCLGREPIPRGHVLKVNKALQGHPEAPRLWHKHIDKILTKELGFTATTHETCLYHKMIDGDLVLLLRQVDDFSIASNNPAHCEQVRKDIESRMQNPLNDLGVIKRFNGIDILQARDFVKVSCETYIDKIVTHHGWQNEVASNQPIPMRADSASLQKLELSKGSDDPVEAQALETEMGFSYRQAIGELIFAMTVGRIDISYPIIKLSQYSAKPSKAHYQAVKQIFVYLNATRDHGLTYWRTEPNMNLPYAEPPNPISAPSSLDSFPVTTDANELRGYVDSDWGSDRQHRRSISGIVFMLAGAAIFYKTRYQPTVALSSTEAEFAAAADAGKAALYLRSILHELGVEQLLPTVIYEDNNGARLMTNAQQPTRRTRHVELKQFAVLQWVEDEQIIFGDIGTANNISDSLTKQTGRIKFYQHHDILMGRLRPAYTRTTRPEQPSISKVSFSACDYINTFDYFDYDLDTVTSMGR